jgi:uncharacterized protein (TIGR02466 family)
MIKLTQHQLFSVPIWATTISDFDDIKDDFISTAYEIRKSEQNIIRSNVNGYHSLPNHQKDDRFRKLIELILSLSYQATRDLEFQFDCHPVITDLWVNFNEERSHINVEHIHDGCFSGVFYLQCPSNSGNLVIKNPAINQLWKGLIHRSKSNIYNKMTEQIEPKEGWLFIWPSYLPHSVMPNNHDLTRISVSFNVDVVNTNQNTHR